MSKFKQSFSREKPVYKLDEKKDVLILTEEVDDLQEKMNSQYSETLYYNLERYFDGCQIENLEGIDADFPSVYNDADRVINALENLHDLRDRYNVPDNLSAEEAIVYLRNVINNEIKKGGDTNDEKQTKSAESEE